jgi:GT2 family glycosyltransferase
VANPDFIAALAARLAAAPEVGAVGPRVFLREAGRVQNTVLRFPWLWRRAVDWFRVRLFGMPLRSGSEPRTAEALNGVCVLFRGECLRKVGLFDERTFAYLEDIDWAYRAEQLGWRREYLPVDSVVHLQKETGYEPGGTVDYLLKRNTLYFLLKTRRLAQAAGYSAATLGLAAARRVRGGPREWPGRLARAYWQLWTGRATACMGRP